MHHMHVCMDILIRSLQYKFLLKNLQLALRTKYCGKNSWILSIYIHGRIYTHTCMCACAQHVYSTYIDVRVFRSVELTGSICQAYNLICFGCVF